MIRNSQTDWENKLKNCQAQVERRDRELTLQAMTLEQRHQEVRLTFTKIDSCYTSSIVMLY